MAQAGTLSVEYAPPLEVPLRFFLTAPLFGLGAATLLVVSSEDIFLSRWTPAALATVHLFTVGFMLQIITGALLQILPVVAGAGLVRVRLIASLVHPLLAVAAVALALGFLVSDPLALRIAAAAGLAGGGLFLAPALFALWRVRAGGQTTPAVRLAVLGLAVGLAWGAVMALVRTGDLPLAWSVHGVDHVTWVLGVGCFGLVAGVGYLVVPMFQMTPAYPKVFARLLVPVLMGVAVSATLWHWGGVLRVLGLALPAGGFALMTLHLQRRRRRARVDVTFRLWQIGQWAVLAAGGTGVAGAWLNDNRLELLTGVLILAGFFLPVMIGMLYKIIPFIAWIQLQRRLPRPPRMNELLPEPRVAHSIYLHGAALACLCVAPWMSAAGTLGGVLLGAGFLWLLSVELRAWAAFRKALMGAPG